MDFTSADTIRPAQTLDIAHDALAEMRYTLKPALFGSVSFLTLLLDRCEEEPLSLGFLGLFGQFTKQKRQAVTFVYEAVANPADHKKVDAKDGASSSVM